MELEPFELNRRKEGVVALKHPKGAGKRSSKRDLAIDPTFTLEGTIPRDELP